ncbi:MAG: PorV/PorQ family protein [Bacteroidota bacterium]
MKPILVILLVAFSIASVHAQGSAVGASSLKITSHARSASLGESDVAELGRLYAFNMNPASLAGPDGIEVQLSHAQWIQDVQSEHLSTRLPFSFGTLGLLLSTSSVRGIEIRDRPGLPVGTFNARAARFQLGFASKVVEEVVIGASIKYLYEKLYVDEATGYGFDIGAIYRVPFEGVTAGLSVTNLGSMQAFRSSASDLPTTVRLGGSYRFEAPVVTCSVSAAYANDVQGKNSHLQLGLELLHDEFVAGRVGYQTGFETRGLSAGIGIRWTMIDLDYAYVPFSLGLGDAHLFSVGFRF